MSFAAKMVRLNDKQRTVMGVSAQDPYFNAVVDDFEDDFVGFCRLHIKEDYKCWDIGSNIGVVSTIISDFCPKGQVVALDGGKKVSDLHCQNNRLNNCQNVEVLHCAMSDSDEPIGFDENSAYGNVNAEAAKVPSITPASLVKRKGWAPDFVKIDCEGHEHVILKAGVDVFKKYGTLVQLEFNTWSMIGNKIIQPMEFLEWIVANFEHVYVRSPGKSELESMASLSLMHMLWRNMTQQPYTFLDEIVLTSDKARLVL